MHRDECIENKPGEEARAVERTCLAHSEEINEKIKEQKFSQKTAEAEDAFQVQTGKYLKLCAIACLLRGYKHAENATAKVVYPWHCWLI